jgi:hypothetical protein
MKRAWLLLSVALSAGGCESPALETPSDASTGDAASDASVDDGGDAARQVAARSHVLFLNTEGVTVTHASNDDATKNQSVAAKATATLQPFLAGVAARQATIDAIVGELRAILAPYDVTIATSRPAGGPYDMIVLTDSASDALGYAGVPGVYPLGCNGIDSVVGFLNGPWTAGSVPQHRIVRDSIAIFGIAAGVPASTSATDCMCALDAACGVALSASCTIGGAGTPVTTLAANCGVTDATMNEAARFLAAFGAHL